MTHTSWYWPGLLALGAFHGLNPGMGWLFATALGLQERSRGAVYRALLSLALGHGLAIAATVAVGTLAGAVVPVSALQWGVAIVLLAWGVRVARHGHPRWVGMRVGPKDLIVWSFLVASAHGAGLMVLPLVLGAAATHHAAHVAGGRAASAMTATAIHTTGYLAVSAMVALIVFEKFGVALLRKAWFNLDLVWAVALVVAAVMTLVA